MKQATLDLLDSDYAKYPMLVAGPATPSDISQIEEFTGYSLPQDYKVFVEKYGGAIVGPYSVFGFGASEAMGDDESSAIEVTKRFRSQDWPGTKTCLVISIDHAGNAITLDANGHVRRYDHDCGSTELIAESFEDFVTDWCLAK